jgi:hypothetical protein
MELFIKHSYRRQSQKTLNTPDFMILTENERRYFTSGVAAFMGALDLPNQITRDQFERVIKTLYESIPNSASTAAEGLPRKPDRPLRERLRDVEEPAQEVANDVRSAGILVSDQSKPGALQFAHKSFMEYLIARAFGDYISKRDLEASSAIVAATGLKASHILGHRESTSFLAEILIGFLTSVEAQMTALAGGGSSSLYKMIVVDPLGGGIAARLRGRLALRILANRAHVRAMRRSRLFISRALAFYTRLDFLPTWLLMFLWYPWVAFAVFHHPHMRGIPREFFWSWWMIIIGATLMALQVLMVAGSREVAPAVRLWFLCCIVAGMKHEDIAVLTGRSNVVEILGYLEPWTDAYRAST